MTYRFQLTPRLLVVGLTGGCKNRELRLKDTEGREFVARCDSKGCALEQRSGPRAAEDRPDLVLRGPGRMIGVCSGAQRLSFFRK